MIKTLKILALVSCFCSDLEAFVSIFFSVYCIGIHMNIYRIIV